MLSSADCHVTPAFVYRLTDDAQAWAPLGRRERRRQTGIVLNYLHLDDLWRANSRGELCPDGDWDSPGGEQAFAEYRRSYIRKLLQDSAVYGGCKMMRRILGMARVEDIEGIADPQQRATIERMALQIGAKWVTGRACFNTVEDLISAIASVTGKKE